MMPPRALRASGRAAFSSALRWCGGIATRELAYRAPVTLALRARTLWKSYAAGVEGCSARAWVLRGVSLEVERGECVAVLGGRGAGTTTLLHCLAGLRRPDAGTVETELVPLLIQAGREHLLPPRRSQLLLIDDPLRLHRVGPRPPLVRESGATSPTAIIATHELARVRDVADRVLLLHQGRLFPLDRLTGARRVAEPGAR
jgi:ABC-type transporter Mla maintaining outer membrane lipid asymmetry ATPase subunit MlaF